jgi:hypothetical protein
MTPTEIWNALVALLGNPFPAPRPTTTFAQLGFQPWQWRVFIQGNVRGRFGVLLSPNGLTTLGQLAMAISAALNQQHLATVAAPKGGGAGKSLAFKSKDKHFVPNARAKTANVLPPYKALVAKLGLVRPKASAKPKKAPAARKKSKGV